MSKKPTTEVTCKPLQVSNGKRPVVIKASKYRKMLATISGQDCGNVEAEEQQRYKTYLKKGSDELAAKWERSFKQSQEQKLIDRNKRFAVRTQKEQGEYQKIKMKDENIRREKIDKAEELIQKLKPYPKKLQSAAMQSEALKAGAYERNINKEFEETLKKQSTDTMLKMEVQAMPLIEEEQRRIADSTKRQNEHKADIMKTIHEKARQKAETTSQVLAAERAARGLCDNEIRAHIDKEQALLKRKREALRKNALEAMIMGEQYQDNLQGQLFASTTIDLANRLKNTEINAAFVEKQQEKIQKKLCRCSQGFYRTN